MKIPVGTKSVLWGVHQFIWHPITVLIAWKKVHRTWPNWWQLLAIIFHDSPGYIGCKEMDGPDGLEHPYAGARWAARIAGILSEEAAFKTYFLSLYHSSNFAKLHGAPPSDLYLPDKVSILVEPRWFYMLRARLSGELEEFVTREALKQNRTFTDSEWLDHYRQAIQEKLNRHHTITRSKKS